jgi:2-polyprenyl-6-methoxyphenol hydroxylase-like FAD-dependent oxidoreductase
VTGVRYRGADGEGEMRAQLTVGADGRGSVVRRLGGFDSVDAAASIDVLWFRLTKPTGDAHPGFRTIITAGALLVLFDRGDHWQVGYVIRKGDRQQVRRAGLETLRESIRAAAPEFTESVEELREWRQISALTVKSSRVKRWHRPGLLLIGDAAHVMTPIGGVGINVAVQDAVVAANRLARPLHRHRVTRWHLASIQRWRIVPVMLVQGYQRLTQRRVAAPALNETFSQPAFVRIPFVRNAITRLLAIGPWRVRVRS